MHCKFLGKFLKKKNRYTIYMTYTHIIYTCITYCNTLAIPKLLASVTIEKKMIQIMFFTLSKVIYIKVTFLKVLNLNFYTVLFLYFIFRKTFYALISKILKISFSYNQNLQSQYTFNFMNFQFFLASFNLSYYCPNSK